jgi:hypothetical protein
MSNNSYDLFELNNVGSESLVSKFYPEEFYMQKQEGVLFLFNDDAKKSVKAPNDLVIVATLENLRGITLSDGVSALAYQFQDDKEDLEEIVFDIAPRWNSKINYFVFDKKTNEFNHEKTSIYNQPRLFKASALNLYTIPDTFKGVSDKQSKWEEIIAKYKND